MGGVGLRSSREGVSQGPHPHPRNPPWEGAAQQGASEPRNPPFPPPPPGLWTVSVSLSHSLWFFLISTSFPAAVSLPLIPSVFRALPLPIPHSLSLLSFSFYLSPLSISPPLSSSVSLSAPPPVRPCPPRTPGPSGTQTAAGAGLGPGAVGQRGGVGPDTWCPRRAGGGSGNPDKPRSPGPAPRPSPPSHLISSWHLPPLPLWKSHQRPPAFPLLGPRGAALGPAPSSPLVRARGSAHHPDHAPAPLAPHTYPPFLLLPPSDPSVASQCPSHRVQLRPSFAAPPLLVSPTHSPRVIPPHLVWPSNSPHHLSPHTLSPKVQGLSGLCITTPQCLGFPVWTI